MTVSAKIRQRRWRQRQYDKRQVTVMLSNAAYEDLNKVKKRSGESYSSITEKAISNFWRTTNPEKRKQVEMVNVFSADRDYRENKLKAILSGVGGADNERLQEEIAGHLRTQKILKENVERFRIILENSCDVIYLVNIVEQRFEYVSPSSLKVWGYAPEEIKAHGTGKILSLVHPDDQERVKRHLKEFINKPLPGEKDITIELRIKHKDNGYRWMSSSHTLIYSEKKQPVAMVGNFRDIHRCKETEIELRKLKEQLEKEVKKRTASLRDANIALKLMLTKEQEIKTELDEKIQCNLKEMALPFIERLKPSLLNPTQREYLDILELNLRDILSPFVNSLKSTFLGFTPTEIKVASLIKYGRGTKEIADLMSLSCRTVEFHRANIREKLGIKNKKENLRAFLLALEH